MKIISNSSQDTIKIGKNIGQSLRGGEVVFFSGILGAGKTVLARGIAQALGVKSKVTSPTFNIFKVYNFVFPRRNIACYVPTKSKLYHFDCYRLKKYSDLANLGWEEILADQNSIVILEWPECIEDADITKLKGKNIISVVIKIGENGDRVFDIQHKK